MHEILYHRQRALGDADLREYASELGLDLARFDSDFDGEAVLERIRRDVSSGLASGEVMGTPTLFIDGTLHRTATTHDSAKLACPHERPDGQAMSEPATPPVP